MKIVEYGPMTQIWNIEIYATTANHTKNKGNETRCIITRNLEYVKMHPLQQNNAFKSNKQNSGSTRINDDLFDIHKVGRNNRPFNPNCIGR